MKYYLTEAGVNLLPEGSGGAKALARKADKLTPYSAESERLARRGEYRGRPGGTPPTTPTVGDKAKGALRKLFKRPTPPPDRDETVRQYRAIKDKNPGPYPASQVVHSSMKDKGVEGGRPEQAQFDRARRFRMTKNMPQTGELP